MGNYLVALTEASKLEIEHRWNGVEERKPKKKFVKIYIFGSAYGSLKIWDRTPLQPSVRSKNLHRCNHL